MMVSKLATFNVVALVSACLAAPASAADQSLPWDGRGVGLTVDTITDKYLTHILTMRNGGTDGKVSDYVTITQDARSSYNEDTAIIAIGVDGKAIFRNMTNFRRTELIQNITNNVEGVTFFRTSVMKEEAFLNPYAWQMIYTETHIFEIRVDATLDIPKIIYLNNGTYDSKWESKFVPGTWYNFGFGITTAPSGNGSVLAFYMSEGNKDLVLVRTDEVVTEFPTNYQFAVGALTLSDDGSEPVMNEKPDVLSYNGISVTAEISTAGSVGGSGTEQIQAGNSPWQTGPPSGTNVSNCSKDCASS